MTDLDGTRDAAPPVRLAVVGCGRIARLAHLPALAAAEEVEVVAVADADARARSEAVRVVPGARAVADVDALLDDARLDGVVVCAPTEVHEQVAVAAFGAGKAVYLEKPLAPTLEAAERIQDAWRRSACVGATGFNFRFNPQVRAAREAVTTGSLGSLVGVRTVFGSGQRDLPAWRRQRATGGGALLDLAVHHVDALTFLTGARVRRLACSLRSVRSAEDTALLQLELDRDGLGAQILVSTAARLTDRLEVLGDLATLRTDRMGSRRVRVDRTATPVTLLERLQAAGRAVDAGLRGTFDGLRPPPEPSFATALRAFAAAVRVGDQQAFRGADIHDGVAGLAVIDAAHRAADTGGWVTVQHADP